MPKNHIYLIFPVFFLISSCSQPNSVQSPDTNIEVSISLDEGTPYYTVRRGGEPLINKSRLGVAFKEALPLGNNFSWAASNLKQVDEAWEQPWGEVREIRNHYNELRVSLQEETDPGRKMDIVFRVYDYGFGFRYEWPEQDSLQDFVITDEWSEFALAEMMALPGGFLPMDRTVMNISTKIPRSVKLIRSIPLIR